VKKKSPSLFKGLKNLKI